MADSPVSLLPVLAAPISTDILLATDDPAGAPLSTQLAIGTMVTAIGLTYDAVNSRIQLADAGTDALPALALDTDPNTGIYWSAADTLAISAGGSLRLSVAAAAIKNPIDSAGYYTGASDDLRLYHDGTNSFLANATGILRLQNVANATMEFYTNNTVRGRWNATGEFVALGAGVFNPADSAGYYTGASDDLRMYHDGTDSHLVNATGTLNLTAAAGSSAIVSVTGSGNILLANATNFFITKPTRNDADSQGYYTGASQDLRMYHDGTDSFLTNITGVMSVVAPAGASVNFTITGTGDVAYVQATGMVLQIGSLFNNVDSQGYYTGASNDLRMYHDGTNSHLLNITGRLIMAAPAGESVRASITGTGDVFVMQATGLFNNFDSAGFYTGASQDLRMYHDGTDSLVSNATGKLEIRNVANAATEIYTNNILRWYVTNSGHLVTNADSFDLKLGASFDFVLSHNGTANIMSSATAGVPIYINTVDSGLRIPIFAADPATIEDGMIWYDSVTDKLMVRANGVSVAVH